jgi:nucleoside-diphosphate-sugar epimerase
MKGRVLITGGGGYLGSTLSGELLKNGYEVDVVDRLNYGDAGIKFHTGKRGYRFHKLDIADIGEVQRLLGKTDCVVHLAALVGESLCNSRPEETWRVNVEGTQSLVEMAGEEHLPVVFASTCSNYGITDGWATEETSLNPQGLYAKSKIEAERAISQLYFHTILRFATLYGVSPRMRLDLMLNEWTKDVLFNKCVEVYQPTAYRPIVHVRDAARAIRGILDNLQHSQNQMFNVGCNDYNFTKEALAEIIKSEVGGEVKVVQRGDPRSYRVSFDKIRRTFGFHPEVSPWEGVREVKAFLEQSSDSTSFTNARDYVDSSF